MTRQINNPGAGRQPPTKRNRIQVWLDDETATVVKALAAQRRQSHSRVGGALIATALKDLTDGND
jgi:hypothetical protein